MITIHGESDDLVEVNGSVREEYCTTTHVDLLIGWAEASPGESPRGLRVRMNYASDGCWLAVLAPVEEDAPCPWPVRVEIKSYSVVVIVDCPDDVPVTRVDTHWTRQPA